MRDFEKVGTELARVDLVKEFNNGKDCFAVVLNTDYSTGGGIHWYCLYGEKKNNKVVLEYFNSSGKPPLPETQAWLQKTKHHLENNLKIPVDILYTNGIQYQNDEHSCGVYCLMYIWMRLEGTPPDLIKPDKFHDEIMHKARKILFRKEI
jgi:Ulp1 family protease